MWLATFVMYLLRQWRPFICYVILCARQAMLSPATVGGPSLLASYSAVVAWPGKLFQQPSVTLRFVIPALPDLL